MDPSPRNVNDLLEEFDAVPLFMRDLPEDYEDNVALQALQALAYDGTPQEIAENFKEQGGDAFSTKRFKDAAEYYTKALAQPHDELTPALIMACYLNRAACQLELHNYGKVLNDCAQALERDPKNVKAYYRSAKACRLTNKHRDALDACKRGLSLDPTNTTLLKELDACKKAYDDAVRKRQREQARLVETKQAEARLLAAIKVRAIRLEPEKLPDSNLHPHRVRLDQESGTLVWPVMFFYPEYRESDLVAEVDETTPIYDQVREVFAQPAPWDAHRAYTPSRVELWYEGIRGEDLGITDTKRPDSNVVLVRVKDNQPLGMVLMTTTYTVKNGVPSFIVLVEGSAFKKEFLSKYYHIKE
jgi:tetratricopeptide (TPR) repeat protein